MPVGRKDQKRPADVIGNAIRVAKITTGEIEEEAPADSGKDEAAQARWPERRAKIAKKAAEKRWKR